MTIYQLLKQSGLKLTGSQRSTLGLKIRKLAYDKKVKYNKIEEVIVSADYPESFIPDMQEEILKFVAKKHQPQEA